MLELDAVTIEDLKQKVITDDEVAIRSEFKFRKNVDRYPLVYVERGSDGLVERILIDYVALIYRSQEYDMGSLLIRLKDGRWTRICSLYLNEMQTEEAKEPADMFDGDSLFG